MIKQHLILIGFMGVGKTTVGRRTAKQLGLKFCDLDSQIVQKYGAIQSIFNHHGEAYFREVENEMLVSSLTSEKPMLISTGGGIVTHEKSLQWLGDCSNVIWLKASYSTVLRRVRQDALSGGLAIAKIYLYLVFPIALSVSVIMIFLRPIYVLTICDLYSDYLRKNYEKANLPNNPSKGKKAVILFILISAIVAMIAGFRDQIGLTNLLSETPSTFQSDNQSYDVEIDTITNNLKNYQQCMNEDGGTTLDFIAGESYQEYTERLEAYCSDNSIKNNLEFNPE